MIPNVRFLAMAVDALRLFRHGFDTYDIARMMDLHETDVLRLLETARYAEKDAE